MNKFILLISLLLSTTYIHTQTFPTTPPNWLTESQTRIIYSTPILSVHDYAMQEIKDYVTYMKFRGILGNKVYYNYYSSRFTIDENGKIELDNISIEEALLLLYSLELKRSAEDNEARELRDQIATEEISSVPPKNIHFGRRKYNVYNLPKWDDKILGIPLVQSIV